MLGRLIFGSHAWHKSEDGAIDFGKWKPTKLGRRDRVTSFSLSKQSRAANR